ncbi:MFS transporter [Chloroflexota bacterium]
MADTIPGESSPYSGKLSASPLIPYSHRRSVISFCTANFLWWVSLYLYVPVLPVYVQLAGAQLNMVGVVLAAYAIPQVLLRIPVGLWSDRMGRRKPLVVTGIIVVSLGALGLGLAETPWLLFLARMTTGIGAAMWVVFPVYLTAYYPAKDSGRAIALINFVRGGALIVATAGGGFIAEAFGLRQTFLGAAVLGLLALFAFLFAKEQPVAQARDASWRSFLSVATRPMLVTVSIMGIMVTFSNFAGVFGFVPIYAAQIGASSSELGLITMVNLGFSTLGSLAVVWLWGKLGYRVTIILGAVFIGTSLMAVPFILTVPALMAVQVSYGLGTGILGTTLMALSIRGLSREQQATAMGVFQAVYAVGMLMGPLVSGYLGAGLGLSAIFFVAAFLTLLVAIMAFLPVLSRRATV